MKLARRLRCLFLLAAAVGATAQIAPRSFLEEVRLLASARLGGRRSGTPQSDAAARHIAGEFRASGLETAGGDYLQPFRVTVRARMLKGNLMEVTTASGTSALKPDVDFRPLALSADGDVSGQVVFAGYGITAPEYGYDEYAGLDVKGKIVLLVRHEPQEHDVRSVFAGRIYTSHAQLLSKARNAKLHGAAAVLYVCDRWNHPTEQEELEPLGKLVGPDNAGIPFVQLRSEVAAGWLREAGASLDQLLDDVDRDLRPRSRPLTEPLGVRLAVRLERVTRPASNVIGLVRGQTQEHVIVGAHYDHIGRGEQYSMDRAGKGRLHPGADDNASGAAGLIELARWFGARPPMRRGVLLMAFSGEEFGLLGSFHYVENPRLPLEKAVAMVNMDMIGRLRDDRLLVGGTETASGFHALIHDLGERAGFLIEDADLDGYGSSDHCPFLAHRVPVLFFFTGLHPDYHTPRDTPDAINAEGGARVVRMVAETVEMLASAPERPQFVRQAPAIH